MADALRSGRSARKGVRVRLSLSAPNFFIGVIFIYALLHNALVAQLDRAQPCEG